MVFNLENPWQCTQGREIKHFNIKSEVGIEREFKEKGTLDFEEWFG